jgi:hypothetical protein
MDTPLCNSEQIFPLHSNRADMITLDVSRRAVELVFYACVKGRARGDCNAKLKFPGLYERICFVREQRCRRRQNLDGDRLGIKYVSSPYRTAASSYKK